MLCVQRLTSCHSYCTLHTLTLAHLSEILESTADIWYYYIKYNLTRYWSYYLDGLVILSNQVLN